MDGKNRPLETLRNAPVARRLSEALNREAATRQPPHSRRNLRLPFYAGNVLMTLWDGGPSGVHHLVVPRNLSRNGLAFIHGRFVYPDIRCAFAMPQLAGGHVGLTGKILRCRHLSGIAHEVTVLFDDSIDLPLFVRMNENEQSRHQHEVSMDIAKQVAAFEPLVGSALIYHCDVKHGADIKTAFEDLGLTCRLATSHSQLFSILARGEMQMLVIDVNQPDGVDRIEQCRELYDKLFILAIGDDHEGEAQENAINAGCSAFVRRPIDPRDAHQVVAMGLGQTQCGDDGLHVANDQANEQQRIKELTSKMQQAGELLKQARDQDDWTQIAGVCEQLAEISSETGNKVLAELALLIEQSANDSAGHLSDLDRSINNLISMTNEVQFGKPGAAEQTNAPDQPEQSDAQHQQPDEPDDPDQPGKPDAA